MSSKLTGAWPILSLWLKQAPWGTVVYDKWGVLQINCSYCPCSGTLTKGEQSWLCWCWATITHSNEPTLYSGIHITTRSQYPALITYDLINSATVNLQAAKVKVSDLWAIPHPIPLCNINYKPVMHFALELKDFSLLKRDKMIEGFSEKKENQYIVWVIAGKYE